MTAPTKTLDFRPFSPSSNFTWEGFRLGSGDFSVAFKRRDSSVTLEVTNENAHAVTVRYRAILPEGKSAKGIQLDGKRYAGKVGQEKFFESAVVAVEAKVKAGATGRLEVRF